MREVSKISRLKFAKNMTFEENTYKENTYTKYKY